MASVAPAPHPLLNAAPATGRAVFDLDRTLVRGSSLARLARALNEARLVRRKDLTTHVLREAVFAMRELARGGEPRSDAAERGGRGRLADSRPLLIGTHQYTDLEPSGVPGSLVGEDNATS